MNHTTKYLLLFLIVVFGLVIIYDSLTKFGMFEGLENQTAPPAQCEIKIDGACKSYPNMSNKDWFADNDFGGPKPTNLESCKYREQSWKKSCSESANISAKYNQQLIPTPPAAPPAAATAAAAAPAAPAPENKRASSTKKTPVKTFSF
jgi:hypothetical protein